MHSGTVLHNFAHIFDLLARLRQAVDHPYLLIHGSLCAKSEGIEMPTPSRNVLQSGVCVVCLEDLPEVRGAGISLRTYLIDSYTSPLGR